MHELSVCAIVRNEQDYIEEWVNMARAVGVEHFYIYDNSSVIPVKTILAAYIAAGIVDVIVWPGTGQQMTTTSHCMRTYGQQNHWIAVIDADEMLIPKSKDTVQEVLADYEGYGGLNVSWRIFGSNGHQSKPDGYVTENYTRASPIDWYENTHTKAIVQPARVLQAGSNPHFCLYRGKYHAVSEDYKLLVNAWTPHCANKIQLNHYFLKSKSEFQIKVAKPRADVADPNAKGRTMADFDKFDGYCTIEDTSALRFVEKMKGLYL